MNNKYVQLIRKFNHSSIYQYFIDCFLELVHVYLNSVGILQLLSVPGFPHLSM